MKHPKLLIAVICLIFSSFGCKKQPGSGGLAQITGRIYADTIFDNKNNKYLGSGYVANVSAYLCYGTDTVSSQSSKTSYNGAFTFNNLQKGDYSVYVLSDNMVPSAGNFNPYSYRKQKISITAKTQIGDLGTFHINYAY